jgi:tRNA1(Val) A37 N6-methylase TrmN6
MPGERKRSSRPPLKGEGRFAEGDPWCSNRGSPSLAPPPTRRPYPDPVPQSPKDLGPITDNAILGGRLRLRQPERGHRVGHDAILLAASCPARAEEAVADLGSGVGAAGLALAARVEGAAVTLVEVAADLARLAAENAERNGFSARVRVVVLDATATVAAFEAAGLAAQSCARVIMNPPFNHELHHQLSPDEYRRRAHLAPLESLPRWIKTAARLLRPRGTLSLIWRADGLAEVLAALDPAFGGVVVLPVHPKPDQAAIRILVRAAKASRAPLTVLPGLVLNDAAGRPTAAAEAVLRGGEALALDHA